MNILNDFAIALVQPAKYKELLKNSAGRVVVYVIILMLISSVSLYANMKKVTSMLGEYFESNIPEFTFENQILKSEDVFDLELAGTKIAIDTDRQLLESDFGKARMGIMFDADSMLIKQGMGVREFSYSDVTEGKDITLTKASLYNYKDFAKLILNIYTVIFAILSVLLFLFGALITALLARLIVGFLPSEAMDIKFGSIYKLALYSRALPVILSIILSMFIGKIPALISVLLSVTILTRAMANIAFDKNV